LPALANAASLAPALGIAYVMARQLSSRGTDIYGQTVAVSHRTDFLLLGASHLIVPTLVVASLAILMRQPSQTAPWQRATIWLGAAFCVIASIYVSQVVAYNGNVPSGGRYDFPVQLCLPALWVALTAYVGHLDHSQLPLLRLRQALFLSALITLHHAYGAEPSRANRAAIVANMNANIKATAQFSNALKVIVDQAREDPDRTIILDGRGALESYEPMASFARYLKHKKVRNPIAIRFERSKKDEHDTFIDSLAAAMEHLQLKGVEGGVDERMGRVLLSIFAPLRQNGRPQLKPLAEVPDADLKRSIIVPIGIRN
jgi:hypothetical protein